uniref:Uncharacterized protein n=1 Tax=Pseudomonas syringae pv. actinidiae TaxID=103796 RepID=A0A2P0QFL4_PSESF|nr:hypothetical protein [Pseudomonas syringae pv. actinidiae]ARO45166.1 hypothetical protein [Pseudomonas syringae pv. actinidiae]
MGFFSWWIQVSSDETLFLLIKNGIMFHENRVSFNKTLKREEMRGGI